MHNSIIPFALSPIDPVETERTVEKIEGFFSHKKADLILFKNGDPAIAPDGSLLRVDTGSINDGHFDDPGCIFLGLDGERPVFAASMATLPQKVPQDIFQSLRMIAGKADLRDLGIIGKAKSLIDWHKAHRFCANCGEPSQSKEGGIKRDCATCQTEHFPRVNPVVIMLIVHEDKVLLGRSPGWPEGVMSTPAGFVSPGETIEDAVYREVFEETGLRTRNARYLFSQPWPFPSQLMMGMICDADSDDLTLNKDELEYAEWFSKDTVRDVFDRRSQAFRYPPSFAISHHLLKYWIAN